MKTHLDLFSGIGGFALAAKWAGFKTNTFCEIDPFCRSVLRKNFPNCFIFHDIHHITERIHTDLLTAGFPCQPFSIAGKRKGEKDERYLWPELLRCIQQSKPLWVVLENVAGLLDMGIENILSDLENEGYESQTYIIPACAANAPHRRDRLWVVANRDGERFDMRVSDWEERLIQDYKKRNVATLQSEWEKFKPKPWATYTAQDWLDFNARVSRNNDGLSRELDKPRIKALGNAIVPQVAYPILKTIHDLLCLY